MCEAAESLLEYMASELKIDEDSSVMTETVDFLVDAGICKPWQLKHAPKEKIDCVLAGEGMDQHRTLVEYARSLAQEGPKTTLPPVGVDAGAMMAKAVSMMAKEQRKCRKRKQGEVPSSSEEEEDKSDHFDLTKSLEEYGLAGITHDHWPRMKVVRPMVRKLKKKYDENQNDVLSEHVTEFSPMWMKTPSKDLKPKHMGGSMTHPEWVAAWWSRALVQLMAQGHAKKATVSVESLLLEFLNANKVAAEEHMDVGWEYDKHLWKNIAERIAAKDRKLDVKEAMSDASEKKVAEVQKEMKQAAYHNSSEATSPQAPTAATKNEPKVWNQIKVVTTAAATKTEPPRHRIPRGVRKAGHQLRATAGKVMENTECYPVAILELR